MSLDFHADSLTWILIAFVIAGILIYGFSRRLFTQVSPAAAWGLITLRIAAAGLLLAILSEPVSRMLLERSESPGLAVLVDASASMGLSDRLGKRDEVLSGVLNSEALNTLKTSHQVRSYRFSEDLAPLLEGEDDSLSTDGTGTDLGAALSFLENSSRPDRFAAAILVTDGNFTVGRDPLRVAEDLDIPIYTVGIGDTLGIRDLSLPRITANDVVYAGSNVPVEVVVRGRGFSRVRVPVTLREDGRILQSAEVTLDGQDGEQTAVFHIVPETEGVHSYQVEVPELDGEITPRNNRRTLTIKVLKSRLRILYIEGSPRTDLGFLRRALEKDANLEVTSLVFRPDGETFPVPMPSSRMEWFSYDLVILGSIAHDRLQPWVPYIVSFVEEKGGGLIALGGPRSFEMGGYAGTPVGNLMPFHIPASARGMTAGPFVPATTPDGSTHPITRLDDDPVESERLWIELPPLPGMNQVGPAKPGATVLATNPTWRTSEEDTPVIAVHRYGQGKVLAIAAQGLWQWDLMMWGSGGTNAAYERLWNNAVRWMTVREGSRRIRVASDKLQYRGGETVRFDGQIYDENYRPVDHADLSVTVRSELDGEGALQLDLTSTGQGFGRYAGRLQFLSTGEYRFDATAELNGVPLGSDSGGFVVGEAGGEFERTRMNRKLLAQLSDMTGGRFYLASEIGSMAEDLSFEEIIVQETRTYSWWNHPAMLMLLIGLLTTEWLIRRYLGMV